MAGFFAYLAAHTTPGALLIALILGVLGGLTAGLTPGVSGRAGLLLVTPFAIPMGPVAGAAFLVAFHSVVHTSGSVPAILLGAPTSAAEAATVIDGYAMTRKGEGARAIGASVAASLAGGVIGALLLLALAPVAQGAARFIGSPEISALSVLGLLSISALSGASLAGGLLVASLGVVMATIGIDPFTGTPRLTLGLADLSEGINAAALVTGLFVVPELTLLRRAGSEVSFIPAASPTDLKAVMAGFREALTYRWLLLRASVLSAVVGMAPGLGASVAVWIAYGHARQTQASAVRYGEGAIAGVIAPEAANNAKEGGALAPTLFFGVPGSSGMGILLAAFMVMGVEVGPRMLTNTPGFVYLLGLTNIASNLLAAPLCLLMLPLMARFASIRAGVVAPVALTAGVAAALLTEPGGATLAMIAAASALGLLLKNAGLPRAPLLLGFVLAPAMESGLIRSAMIQGAAAFERPGVLIIIAIGIGVAIAALKRRDKGAVLEAEAAAHGLGPGLAWLAALLIASLAGLAAAAPSARVMPGTAAAIGLTCAVVLAWRLRRTPASERQSAGASDWPLLGLFAGLLAVIPMIGAPIAAGGFAATALGWRSRVKLLPALVAGLVLGGIVFGLQRLVR